MAKAFVPGLSIEQHAAFRQKVGPLTEGVDETLTMLPCPDYEGCTGFICKVKMPMFISNRSLPNLFYLREDPANNSLEFFGSSRGTRKFARQHNKLIDGDVIGDTIINYHIIKQVDGGCEYESVFCIDICGSVPDALARQGAELYVKG